MLPCVCGKSYRNLSALKQHQRYYCRGEPVEGPEICPVCGSSWEKYISMRQHFRLAHPVEYNLDLEGKAFRPKRRLSKSNFDEDAALQLANLEAAYTGRHINIYLASVTEEFTIEEIMAFRKGNKEYRDTVRSIKGLPYDPNPPPDTPDDMSGDEEDSKFVFEETTITTQTTPIPATPNDNNTTSITSQVLDLTNRTLTSQHDAVGTQAFTQSNNASHLHNHISGYTQTFTRASDRSNMDDHLDRGVASAGSPVSTAPPGGSSAPVREPTPTSVDTFTAPVPGNISRDERARVRELGRVPPSPFVPGPDENINIQKQYIADYYLSDVSVWDEKDSELFELAMTDDNDTAHRQALDIWLAPILQGASRNKNNNKNNNNGVKGQHDKNGVKGRKNNYNNTIGVEDHNNKNGVEGLNNTNNTNNDVIRRRERAKYHANAERAYLYKITQERYKKNTTQLASDVLDGVSLLSDPNDAETLPSAGAVEESYTELFATPSPADDHLIDDPYDPKPSFMTSISEEDVQKAIAATKSNTAGPDGVTLADLRKVPLRKLTLLFNVMILWLVAPPCLTTSRTTLIPKGKVSGNIDKWRPITVTSVILRIYHRILAARLSRFSLHPHQRGFQKIDGCFVNNLTLEHIIKSARRRTRPHVIATLDLRRAFDLISHHTMERALRRFGIRQDFVKYLKSTYYRASMTITCMGRNPVEIPINRGVRQCDPLSPFIFNIIMDELITKLERTGKGQTCEDGSKIACLGYADDMVIMADSTRNAQSLLNTAGHFFSDQNLEINVDKCTVMTAATVPARKKLFTATKSALCINAKKLPVITPAESFKYLGFMYGMLGLTFGYTVADLGTQLGRLQKASLKPCQKLFILKRYLIPRFLHSLQNPKINIKALTNADKAIRKFVRKALHLHATSPDAFLYATTREGGLGLPCLRALVPYIMLGRMDRLSTATDGSVLRVITSSTAKKLYSNLVNYTTRYGRTGTTIKRYWSDALERSYSGNGLRQGSADTCSSFWIDHPPPYWTGREYVQAIQLKGNTLPTIGIPSNPPDKRDCRAGWKKTEPFPMYSRNAR